MQRPLWNVYIHVSFKYYNIFIQPSTDIKFKKKEQNKILTYKIVFFFSSVYAIYILQYVNIKRHCRV